ncbi:SGNH/GDSL hydrolase family protein [Tunturiibacter lichenicola]|uniref:hypothetical protein n=1 Tax=Tunturiibacter lichenicola TaxID=2051959 RepID=UPI0021B4007A|nr:hypothetical protein [Edaphobacter lichenicola]
MAISKNLFEPKTDQALNFAGATSTVIPPGGSLMSDPIPLPVSDFSEIVVSLYLPDGAQILTGGLHRYPTVVSAPGDRATNSRTEGQTVSARGITSVHPVLFLSGVAVDAAQNVSATILFGDSNTRLYGGYIVERLHLAENPTLAILNMGLDGNRLLHDGVSLGGPSISGSAGFFGGVAGIRRFETALSTLPGVTGAVLMQGTGDIILPGTRAPASETVTPGAVIDGLKHCIGVAQSRNIRIIGATIVPFGGWDPGNSAVSAGVAWSDFETRDAQRQRVNEWIRGCEEYDGLIDADAVLRDPENPVRLKPAYDAGDHLHFSQLGAETLSDAVLKAISIPS